MVKKCIYCKAGVSEESVVDFCEPCGIGVWGKKMFSTIIRKMEDARARDDLVATNTIGIQELGSRRFY